MVSYRLPFVRRLQSFSAWILMAAVVWPLPAAGQTEIHELDCDIAARACGWKVAWEAPGTRFATVQQDGAPALHIVNPADGVAYVERDIPLAGVNTLRTVRFAVDVGAEAAEGRGAGLTLTVVNDQGEPIANYDLGYAGFGMATGTQAPRRVEIAAAVPPEAVTARLGMILYGPGGAVFARPAFDVQPASLAPPAAFARAYVDEAVEIVRRHSLHRDEIDAESIRRDAYRIAGDSVIANQAYPAIRYIVVRVADGHSFFMSKEEKAFWQNGGTGEGVASQPVAREVDGFGYIAVPGFHSDNSEAKRRFAQAIQDAIADFDQRGVRGWIIDLRGNDGGNMFPMLAGLSPLFDEVTLGYLVDVDGQRDAWTKDPSDCVGVVGEDCVVVERPFSLTRRLPIAVLTDRRTGSSGEIVALSFVGNADTRSFGKPTWGLTTGNGIFPLSDGSEIRLASTTMADRSGKTYGGPVEPDEMVDGDQAATLAAAIAWLKARSEGAPD